MQFLKGFTLTILTMAALAHADIPATHGMLIFGNKVTYASHLPMFHHPHDYQVVMKVSLASGQMGVLASYEQLKAEGEILFTIAPERMDLTKVMNGSITQFKAELFQGHFERGGKKLGNVTVKVEKFLVNTKLDPAAKEQNQFIIFGEQNEHFAAHLINGKPSYDTVVQVKVTVSDEQLPVTVGYISTAGSLLPAAGQILGLGGETKANVLKVIYAEEAELAH